MSFDLKIENGDISFGPDGNPEIVTGKVKLRQDISKILLTRKGEDPGSNQYGSKLQDTLGRPFDFNILQSMVAKDVAEAMNFLQSLQFVQATKQEVGFEEVIGSVDAVSVRQIGVKGLEVQLAVTSAGGLREIFALTLGDQ